MFVEQRSASFVDTSGLQVNFSRKAGGWARASVRPILTVAILAALGRSQDIVEPFAREQLSDASAEVLPGACRAGNRHSFRSDGSAGHHGAAGHNPLSARDRAVRCGAEDDLGLRRFLRLTPWRLSGIGE